MAGRKGETRAKRGHAVPRIHRRDGRAAGPRLALAAAIAAAIAAGTLAPPRDARANGRFPNAQHVLVGPGRASRVIALRSTFGFVVSEDAGATWRWVCEQALDYGGPPWDPPFALDRAGRLHVGLPSGQVRLSADRCGVDRVMAADGQYVVDLDHSPDGDVVVSITGTGSGERNRVLRSDDGGETFRPLGFGLRALFTTLEVARGDTTRVYLTGVAPESEGPRRVSVFRSDDGGATLRELPYRAPANVFNLYVAAVDPRDADTVYLRAELTSAGGADAGEPATLLLRTTNGGESFDTIAQTRLPMEGFAISDDGATLWIGSPDASEGLQRSDDRGARWRRVADVQVQGLRFHDGALYVAANWVRDGYALGRSRNGGETIEPILRFGDLPRPPMCPAGSPLTTLCASVWDIARARLFPVDAGAKPGDMDAGVDAGAGGIDGGARPGAYIAGGGWLCSARGAAGAARGVGAAGACAAGAAGAVAGVAAWKRRRKR